MQKNPVSEPVENSMIKAKRLSAALMVAALVTTPAMARQGQLTSWRLIANARITATNSADGQTRFRPNYSRDLAERDVWGHWGAYYGSMVHAP
jgi:hypothetical protein